MQTTEKMIKTGLLCLRRTCVTRYACIYQDLRHKIMAFLLRGVCHNDENICMNLQMCQFTKRFASFLIEHVMWNRGACSNAALDWVIQHEDDVRLLRILLGDPRVDPTNTHNYPIRRAVFFGCLHMVQMLMADPRVNPADKENYALAWACKNGNVVIARLLLQDRRVEASLRNNEILRTAKRDGKTEIVQLLERHLDMEREHKRQKK